MLKIEVIIGVVASSIAILAFVARAYANLRRGRRIHGRRRGAARSAEAELARMQEEIRAAQEMTRGRDPEA